MLGWIFLREAPTKYPPEFYARHKIFLPKFLDQRDWGQNPKSIYNLALEGSFCPSLEIQDNISSNSIISSKAL